MTSNKISEYVEQLKKAVEDSFPESEDLVLEVTKIKKDLKILIKALAEEGLVATEDYQTTEDE